MHSNHSRRRLAIGASVLVPTIHPDDELFAAALDERGYACEPVIWNDEQADWSSYNGLLIRSIWDYYQHYAQFLRWLDMLERTHLPTLNPVPVLRWNSNKRYLLELARCGVEIIPTSLVRGSDLASRTAVRRDAELVVKPTVSATSWHTVRGIAGSGDFQAAIGRVPHELEYLVQPFMPQIAAEGEWSLVFFGEQFSHAVLKRPQPGDYRVQNEFGGTAQTVSPPSHVLASAERAVQAVRELGYDGCYARVDGIRDGERFLVMEVEMIEPSLFFLGDASAASRFADVVAARFASRP